MVFGTPIDITLSELAVESWNDEHPWPVRRRVERRLGRAARPVVWDHLPAHRPMAAGGRGSGDRPGLRPLDPVPSAAMRRALWRRPQPEMHPALCSFSAYTALLHSERWLFLGMVADGTIDFVFSFDSLVHAELTWSRRCCCIEAYATQPERRRLHPPFQCGERGRWWRTRTRREGQVGLLAGRPRAD